MKNSRGGQEGSGGPGATAAQGPQTRLPLLFRNLGESPGKGATVEGGGGGCLFLILLMSPANISAHRYCVDTPDLSRGP